MCQAIMQKAMNKTSKQTQVSLSRKYAVLGVDKLCTYYNHCL